MNLTIWGVVVAVACSCCFLGVGADFSIDNSFEKVNWSNVSEAFALVKLNNGLNQESWRQLGNETWHEFAVRRFFSVGSLDANRMNALAAQKNTPDTVDAAVTDPILDRLQAISSTHYYMSRSITGTGNIHASMWTLMFSCASTSCSDGYMVPIQRAPEQSYVSLWLPVTDGVLINAIPASISTKATHVEQSTQGDDNRPSIDFNVQENLPPCPKAPVLSFRSLLDSAYGLAPAIACIGFSDDDSFTMVLTSASLGMIGNSDHANQTLETLARARLNLSEWLPKPFEKCSERPLLILPEPSDSLPHMCHHNKCMIFFNSTSQNQIAVQFLKGLEKVLDEGPSECTISLANNITTCDSLYNISSFYDLSTPNLEPFRSSLLSSDWASEEGNDTNEFYYAPHVENLTACVIELIPAPLNQVKEIEIEAIDYLTAYIKDHNIAFTTDNGPATDPYTFYALLITTALSVITIAVPFTNFMLRIICQVRPEIYFNKAKGKDGARGAMASKVLIQVCCNAVLTVIFFLPMLPVAINEIGRQEKYSTWALASDDVQADDTDQVPMRVVYLFAISSQYHSHFLEKIVVVMFLACLVVSVCTAWRSRQVFTRYRLLLAADSSTNSTTSSSSILLGLKAIEMGDAEYLQLKLMHAEKLLKSYYLLPYIVAYNHGLEY